jgi:hypothetical protein
MLGLMLEKDIRNRPDWTDLNGFVGRRNSGYTKPEQQPPKRDHYITRTVRSLRPKEVKKSPQESPETGAHSKR